MTDGDISNQRDKKSDTCMETCSFTFSDMEVERVGVSGGEEGEEAVIRERAELRSLRYRTDLLSNPEQTPGDQPPRAGRLPVTHFWFRSERRLKRLEGTIRARIGTGSDGAPPGTHVSPACALPSLNPALRQWRGAQKLYPSCARG